MRPHRTATVAVVIGTYPYKALDESCRVFDELKKTESSLTLHLFGDDSFVPPAIRARIDVVMKGNRPRSEVIAGLRRAKYYISTTSSRIRTTRRVRESLR